MTALPIGDGVLSTEAWGINNFGDIVGFIEGKGGQESQAFLYRDGKVFILNDLIPPNSEWGINQAMDINDKGQIIGTAVKRDSNNKRIQRAVLLEPVR